MKSRVNSKETGQDVQVYELKMWDGRNKTPIVKARAYLKNGGEVSEAINLFKLANYKKWKQLKKGWVTKDWIKTHKRALGGGSSYLIAGNVILNLSN